MVKKDRSVKPSLMINWQDISRMDCSKATRQACSKSATARAPLNSMVCQFPDPPMRAPERRSSRECCPGQPFYFVMGSGGNCLLWAARFPSQRLVIATLYLDRLPDCWEYPVGDALAIM
jgi:hypothetical protein